MLCKQEKKKQSMTYHILAYQLQTCWIRFTEANTCDHKLCVSGPSRSSEVAHWIYCPNRSDKMSPSFSKTICTMCSPEYEILRIWNSATADVRSSCMLILENMLMCKEIGLQGRQIVDLMYITVKFGINHISRVTLIGIFHVCLKVFINTARMAQPWQKQH